MTRNQSNATYFGRMESPLGKILVVANSERLREIRFLRGDSSGTPSDWIESGSSRGVVRNTFAQLAEYFAGRRRDFDLSLSPQGTPFQQRVWSALLQIGYGQVTSYGEIARRIDLPLASRAVGAANGSNPIPIVIPCHRVIGASGTLTGYGGGLDLKEHLLELEGIRVQAGPSGGSARIADTHQLHIAL